MASPVYLFRHVHFDQCIVSRSFVLRAMHMAQTGNPLTPLRHDKWVPFLVAANLPRPRDREDKWDVERFHHQLAHGLVNLRHGAKVRLPVHRPPGDTDVLQSRARMLSQRLCELLHEHSDVFLAAQEAAEEDRSASEPFTLLWERLADKENVLQESELQWPDWVRHDELLLERGRFPVGLMPPLRPGMAAKPKKMARQKEIWEVADTLTRRRAHTRKY
ncbi:hypothetical protein DFJ74DRAFT_649318 [Hyaloraphidium curvatum]|nr:hypothetical protein DFJ74DRAFT_649318 [Hyaloraphidium curvatum]